MLRAKYRESVAQIIQILEWEGRSALGKSAQHASGELAERDTARHEDVFPVRRCSQAVPAKRNMLWHSDIKYGPSAVGGWNKADILVTFIDDATLCTAR